MMLAATIAAVSGVLVTANTQLFPGVGFDATLKALVICIIAGLGNIRASIFMAVALGLFELRFHFANGGEVLVELAPVGGAEAAFELPGARSSHSGGFRPEQGGRHRQK